MTQFDLHRAVARSTGEDVSVIAARGLLNQQKRAVVWATIVTVAGWGEAIVLVGLFMFLHAAAGPEMYRANVEAGVTPLQMIISLSQLFLLMGNGLFQIFALVVLWRAHPRLIDFPATTSPIHLS